jgi:hypothetical protein
MFLVPSLGLSTGMEGVQCDGVHELQKTKLKNKKRTFTVHTVSTLNLGDSENQVSLRKYTTRIQ